MAEERLPGDGARRAASVLLGLGPEIAGEIFRILGEAEVHEIARGARELRRAPTGAVSDSLRRFVESMERVGGEAVAGDRVLRDFAARALGADAARRAFDEPAPLPPADEVLGTVSRADPAALAMVLSREHPQAVAVVLGALGPDKAAEVLGHVPAERRAELVRRMAAVEAVSPELLREVCQAIEAELKALGSGGERRVDGKAAALEVLRRATGEEQSQLVGAIERSDPALAEELRSRLFTFGDLASLTDRDMQALLKAVDGARLAVALKGAGSDLRDKVMRNMSSRAAQMLSDDLAAMGPLKLSVVEGAQEEIVRQALELAEGGRITLVRPSDRMI